MEEEDKLENIPKPEIAKDGTDHKPLSSPAVCVLCNKNFSSGKALGGHMRGHAQAAIRENMLRKFNQKPMFKKHAGGGGASNNVGRPGIDGGGKPPTCCLCSREFPSMKSLFGHMRLHPERRWRGIHPPPPAEVAKTSSESTISESVTVKVDNQMDSSTTGGSSGGDLRWPKTAKRGRKSTAAAASLEDYGSDDEETLLAASSLILLSQGKKPLNEDEIEEDKDQADNSKNLKISENSSEILPRMLEKDTGFVPKMSVMMMKKKKKKEKSLRDLETAEMMTQSDHSYRCNTCNKSFLSPQALGGHKSSHNKFKNINSIVDESAASENADNQDIKANGQVDENETEEVSEGAHKCKICSKTFSTGQALGGHKRCHWTGPFSAASSCQVTSPGEESQTGRKILSFDLNELPPAMDAEEEEEGAESAAADNSDRISYFDDASRRSGQ